MEEFKSGTGGDDHATAFQGYSEPVRVDGRLLRVAESALTTQERRR